MTTEFTLLSKLNRILRVGRSQFLLLPAGEASGLSDEAGLVTVAKRLTELPRELAS